MLDQLPAAQTLPGIGLLLVGVTIVVVGGRRTQPTGDPTVAPGGRPGQPTVAPGRRPGQPTNGGTIISPDAIATTWPDTVADTASPPVAVTGTVSSGGTVHLRALTDLVSAEPVARQQPRRDQPHPEAQRRRTGRRVLGDADARHQHPRVGLMPLRVPVNSTLMLSTTATRAQPPDGVVGARTGT